MRISDWSSDVCSSELWADVVVMLFPDEEQARVYREELAPNLRPGAALAFAHGLAIRFALIEDRKRVVSGKSVSVRVALGGRRTIKKKKNTHTQLEQTRATTPTERCTANTEN